MSFTGLSLIDRQTDKSIETQTGRRTECFYLVQVIVLVLEYPGYPWVIKSSMNLIPADVLGLDLHFHWPLHPKESPIVGTLQMRM